MPANATPKTMPPSVTISSDGIVINVVTIVLVEVVEVSVEVTSNFNGTKAAA